MPEPIPYTHGHHDSVLRSHRRRTAENSAAYLLPELARGMRLLDVGCGPGTLTCDLAECVAPGPVTAIDAAEGVLVEAAATARERGIAVTFESGDVYGLPYEDGAFDVVHAHQVLQHLADPVAALREMRRVCRPGGIVAVRDSDYAAMTWHPAEPGIERWLAVYREAARRNGAEPDAGRRLLAWAQAADLPDIRPSASVWCFATPADREWWSDLWAERVTNSALAAQLRAQGLGDAALEEMAAAWRRWASAPDAWFAVLHGEILARA